MWIVLSSWVRRWLIFTVAVPLLSAAARKLGTVLERRRGPSGLTRGLHRAGNLARRRR